MLAEETVEKKTDETENNIKEKENADGYLYDVAKNTSYQNQNEEYYLEFVKWRSKPENPYGYKFVKDVREHTYEDGKGFVEEKPAKAEKEALLNCCKLTGLTLLVLAAVTVLQMILMPVFGGSSYVSDIFVHENGKTSRGGYFVASGFFSILRLLLPAVVFKCASKLPWKVILPKAQKRNLSLSFTGITFMMMAVIIGNYTNRYLAKLFALIGIDFSSFTMVSADDPLLLAVYAFCEFIVVSVLTEILFRGMILQTFRQFGDMFALIVSGAVNVLASGDITMTGYVFITSLVVGLFTLRTGSVFTAIAMRISARAAVFLMALGTSYVSPEVSTTVEVFLSITVISLALFAYSRLLTKGGHDFNVTDTMTHMDGKSKLTTILTSKAATIYMVSAVIILILNIRFL